MIKNKLALSIIISLAYLLILNLSIGTYFEEYHEILNMLISHSFIDTIDFTFLGTTWLLVLQALSYTTKMFNNIPIYSVFTTIINFSILAGLLYCVFKITDKSKIDIKIVYVFVSLILILLFDSLFHVHNRRVAFILPYLSVMFVYIKFYHKLSKIYYIPSIFFLILGIIARVEVTIISLFFISLFSYFFLSKKVTFNTILYLIVCVSFFLAFETVHRIHYKTHKKTLVLERNIIDMGNVSVSKKDSTTYFKQLAMMYFIKDDEAYNFEDYNEIIKRRNIIDYVLDFKIFLISYLSKIYNLTMNLSNYVWLLVLFMVNLSFNIVQHRKKNINKSIFRRTNKFLLLVFFSSLFINIIATFHYDILINIIVLFIITNYLFYTVTLKDKVNKLLAINILVIIFLSPFYFYKTVYKEIEDQNLSEKNMEYFRELNNDGKVIVMSNLTPIISEEVEDFSFYPSRLFTITYNSRIKHYYLDLFYYSNASFYTTFNKVFFGENLNSLCERLEKCSGDNVVFISSANYNILLKSYLNKVHGVNLKFEQITSSLNYFDLKAYELSVK